MNMIRMKAGILIMSNHSRWGKDWRRKSLSSGQPLLAGTLEEEIANGAYFPPEIIEKGSGFYSQSWLGVPIMVKDQALGLIALSDASCRTHSTRVNCACMQTISTNVGVALENARLFLRPSAC